MDPILENEASTSDNNTKSGKSKHKSKKKKNQTDLQSGSQTVVGERRKFVVTTLATTSDQKDMPADPVHNNAHTVHFGTRGAESLRPHVRSIFKEKPNETSRASSAEREPVTKEYETFHGTTSSPRSSIFDIFRLRRKSDAKKHQSLMQNVKGVLGGTSKSSEAPEAQKEDATQDEDAKRSDKKYYHTVTGASSRKYSPITRVMDIFRSKPHSEAPQPAADPGKKKNSKQIRRSSIGTTSPTYHKNSYASLDPMQAKQLFREVRGLPKYDPYLSIVQISLGGRDKTRLLLNFFKYHKCHEILPKSAKVIIFETQFLVRKTFPTLISHGIRSAPLWDSNKKKLVGMITVTDFIRILLHLDSEGLSVDELERHTLQTWKRLLRPTRKPLCCVSPDQSLHEAINYLNNSRVHRLLMVDPISGDVLYILSHKRILRFLFVYLNEFPELTFFHKNMNELKIGTYEDIVSITDTTTIKEAFQILLEKDVSALPVLDEDGKLLDVYAKYEVLNLVSEKLYSNLSLSIGEVRNKKKDWEEKLQKCRSSITLYEALEVIVRTESHRLLLVDKDEKLIGIVSLSDILVYLNRIIPTEKKVSSLQELFRPLEENKFTESSKETENEEICLEVPDLNGSQSSTSAPIIPQLQFPDTPVIVESTEESGENVTIPESDASNANYVNEEIRNEKKATEGDDSQETNKPENCEQLEVNSDSKDHVIG